MCCISLLEKPQSISLEDEFKVILKTSSFEVILQGRFSKWPLKRHPKVSQCHCAPSPPDASNIAIVCGKTCVLSLPLSQIRGNSTFFWFLVQTLIFQRFYLDFNHFVVAFLCFQNTYIRERLSVVESIRK